jgi:AcrR family transcriptional regulator
VPPRPLNEIAEACVRVFMSKGYRSAGISDVAKALKLSHGAVYTYADSKQALLYLALLRVLDPSALDSLELPVKTPTSEAIVATVEGWAKQQRGIVSFGFSEVLSRPSPRTSQEAVAELEAIVDQIYGFIAENRFVLNLFARCAEELPALAQWYFVEQRRGTFAALGDFLDARIKAGVLRAVPDVPTAARFVVESIAWFAMHRHGDPDSAMLTDENSRRTVLALVPAAFLPSGESR